ncbi:MAG: hypothetical protein RJB11_2329 [Planctomycetota bacterium]
MLRHCLIGCLTAVFGLVGTSMCSAQTSGASSGAVASAPLLSVSAQESVTLQPVAVQLRVPFRVEGRQGEEAIASIREHRKTVEKLLGELGRTDGTYRWTMPILTNTVPFVENPESARQWMRRQAAQMQVNNPQMRGRLREMLLQEEEELDGDSEPLPFIHAATNRLVAEWPITEETLDGSIEFGAKLRRLAQSKDFRGTKLRVQLSEEELEQIMPLMGASAYVSSSMPTGNVDSQVLYVGVLSEGQEAAALKKCFEKAKGQAQRLAEAAGKQLGEVRMISSTIQSLAPSPTNTGPSYVNGVLVTTPYAVQDAQEKTERRVLQSNPNDLVLSVGIQVGFEIR